MIRPLMDERGFEFVSNFPSWERLPDGWAYCGECRTAWNDSVPTGWTPAPSARCPFEYEHGEQS